MKTLTFGTVLVVAVGFGLAVPASAAAAPAWRQSEYPHDTPYASLRLGGSTLTQLGDSPPLCCGERDHWTLLGPAAGLRAGYLFGSRLEISAEVSGARLSGESTNNSTALDVSTVGAVGEVGVIVLRGSPKVTLGLGAGLYRYLATAAADASYEAEEASRDVAALRARVAAEFSVAPEWMLGFEVTQAVASLPSYALDFGLTVSFSPLALQP